jgi:hypothetical protein
MALLETMSGIVNANLLSLVQMLHFSKDKAQFFI